MWKSDLEVTIIFLWVWVGVGEHFFMGLFPSFFLERPTRSQIRDVNNDQNKQLTSR